MKKFKILLATVLVFVMTFALVACSSPIVGEWELVKMKEGSHIWTGDDLEDTFGEMKFVFNSDGTGEVIVKEGFRKTTRDFEWEINKDGDRLTIDYENGAKVKADIEIDGDELKMEQDDYDGVIFTFKRK